MPSPAFFPGPANPARDPSSRDGANRCAETIRAAWLAAGYAIKVEVGPIYGVKAAGQQGAIWTARVAEPVGAGVA